MTSASRTRFRPDGSEILWPVPYWFVDAGCALMLVLLAAVDAGLAAGVTGAPDIPALPPPLDIPPEGTPIRVIPPRHPAPAVPPPPPQRARQPPAPRAPA